MVNSLGKICTVLGLALLLLSAGAMAAAPISTIASGNTVFLGEEGLDITAALDGDTTIGWWASAAAIDTSSPSYTISVSNPSGFFVSPTEFAGRLGVWYRLNASGLANGSAFTVADPNLDIRIMDETLGVDATSNGWITTGSEVAFRITTNLYQVVQRPGVAGAPVTIRVQSPDGATFSALVNKNGITTGIVEIPVPTSPYSTGAIWDTGRPDTYPYGTYRIWAECNMNSMKDNYGETGKTYTASSSLLDQERNPLIVTYTRTVSPTTFATPEPTTAQTTVPATVSPAVTTTVTVVTPSMTVPPSALPAATTAKSPGFESLLAGSALLIALAGYVRKN